MGPSIEKTLEKVLEKILQHKIKLQAASRTDKGVHAKKQVVNFFTNQIFEKEKFLFSINSLLPADIKVLSVEKMSPSFHPTLDAKTKTYFYQVATSSILLPHKRHYFWHYHYPIDLKKMKQAASLFLGTHDFSSFCNESIEAGIREITKIEITENKSQDFFFQISGKNFLYKMVRNLVGTLVYIGHGRIFLKQTLEILQKKDRKIAGITAPAHALFLENVSY